MKHTKSAAIGASAISLISMILGVGCAGQQCVQATPADTGAVKAPDSPSSPSPKPTQAPTAAELLERAVARYSAARTYRDAGRCVNRFVTFNDTEMTDTKSFTTAFDRSGKMQYQCQHSRVPGQDASQRFSLWSLDGATYGWAWTIRSQYETGKPAADVFARASRQSGTAAAIVLPLLIEGTGLTRLTALEGATLAGEEAVGDVACTKVSGKLPEGNPATLWIAADGTIWKGMLDQSIAPPTDGTTPAPTSLKRVVTTITLDRAQFDLVIPAWAFEPPPAPPARPTPTPLTEGGTLPK